MISRLPAERVRPNLAQIYRTIQFTTWIASTGLILVILFADPGHKVLSTTLTVFAHLANMILDPGAAR